MTGTDEFGDKLTVFRRARGRVEVIRWRGGEVRDPDDFGAAVPVVAALLARCQPCR